MFNEIHNDSQRLRSALNIQPETLAVLSDADQPFDSGVFTLSDELSLDILPNFPRVKGVSVPVLKLYQGGAVPVLLLPSKPRIEMGYGVHELAYGIRLLGQLGIRSMLFLEKAHYVQTDSKVDEAFFLIEDQVNFMGVNPLVGPNNEAWGPRFPDMSAPFDSSLAHVVSSAAESSGLMLMKAVYAGFLPEQLSSMANLILHMNSANATLAGSSLVQEVMVARHMGIRVCALAHSSAHSGVLPAEMMRLIVEGLSGLH